MTKSIPGIIGGSGIYDLPGFENAQTETVKSPWGQPSAALRRGEIAGLPVVFLSRHDKGHRLSPSDINYRANIDVLKRVGVTDLVSLSACGSFKEESPPGTFVLIDQFVDRTFGRQSSFFGTGCVAHVSMAHPVSPRLRLHIAEAAMAEDIAVVRDGTYVCMEGPQFSTLAESLTYKNLGDRDRHDQHAGGEARPRSRDLLRDRRHGHRLRLLASRPRCGDRAGHHQGPRRQCREGEEPGGAFGARLSPRARAVPDRFRPRARQCHHHRPRSARSATFAEARRRRRADPASIGGSQSLRGFALSPCVLGKLFPRDGRSLPMVHNPLNWLASTWTRYHVGSCHFISVATYVRER